MTTVKQLEERLIEAERNICDLFISYEDMQQMEQTVKAIIHKQHHGFTSKEGCEHGYYEIHIIDHPDVDVSPLYHLMCAYCHEPMLFDMVDDRRPKKGEHS